MRGVFYHDWRLFQKYHSRISSTAVAVVLRIYYYMAPEYLISILYGNAKALFSTAHNPALEAANKHSNIHKWILHAPFTIANAKEILQTQQKIRSSPFDYKYLVQEHTSGNVALGKLYRKGSGVFVIPVNSFHILHLWICIATCSTSVS